MRSSVACSRCRKSKVKCLNDGVGTTCQACRVYQRECVYPVPTPGATSAGKRTEHSNSRADGDSEVKKRARKQEDVRRPSQRFAEDPLANPIFTPKLWQELFDIFKLHYSTELSFLHPKRFRELVYEITTAQADSEKPASSNCRLLLLGILTLTARFHPTLLDAHTKLPNPLTVSQYYADILKREFAPTLDGIAVKAIERVQAILMLGLFEWGETRGLQGWMYVSMATRMAQAMAFDQVDDPDPPGIAPKLFREAEQLQIHPRQAPISVTEKEIRRRTFWSAAILDRYLAGGRHRSRIIQPNETLARLPCSEASFLFDEDTESQTEFLRVGDQEPEFDLERVRAQNQAAGEDGAVLSRLIRLVEIWGEFSKWSTRGGRRTEIYPPWDSRTTFWKLRKKLEHFHASLPNRLFFRASTLESHIDNHSATMYVSLHTLYFLCIMVLHREYIPFIPLRCVNGPEGPLDAPLFPPDQYPPDPPDFWVDSARQLFRAAAHVMDIVQICHKRDALPESTQIAFALYTATFSGVYALQFPNMDTEGLFQTAMNGVEHERTSITTPGRTSQAVKVLKLMRTRMKMAGYYVRTVRKLNEYIEGMKEAVKNKYVQGVSPSEVDNLTLRDGAPGGGLEEYKLVEHALKDFGVLEAEELPHEGEGSEQNDPPDSRASTIDTATAAIKKEGAAVESTPVTGFTAVNTARAVAKPEQTGASPYSFPSPNQAHVQPSSIATTNTDTAQPSLNGSYRWSDSDGGYNGNGPNPAATTVTTTAGMAPPGTRSNGSAWPPWDDLSKMTMTDMFRYSEGTIWTSDDLGGFADGIWPNMFQSEPPGGGFDPHYMPLLYHGYGA